MIKDLKFEFDLDDIKVDTQFLSELRKITDHYDTRTSAEEVEAVKILVEKINVVNVLNWQPYFHTMALQCDIQLPISAVKDFRFLIQQTIAEARKVRIQAANYGFIVSCCNMLVTRRSALDLVSHRAYEGENSVRLIRFLRVHADVP